VTTSRALDAYLERIAWGGATSPTLETLAGLLRAHMSTIPFENLDVLLGRPIRLDLDSVHEKLVGARRGGYCFEHTTLFAAAIEALGFRPARHSARVLLFFPRTESPRTHMFLTVLLPEGRFVADPGFGGPGSQRPVPLVDAGGERPAAATHWMARDGEYWVLRTQEGEASRDAWVSTLEQDNPVDFVMANHFTSTHPRSPFVNRILMSLFTQNGRVTVANRDVTITAGETSRSTQLADRVALRALLVAHFGFDLPEVEQLRVPSIPEWS